VQKGVIFFALRSIGNVFEHSLAVGRIDGYEVASKEATDAALNTQCFQRIGILFHAEHGRHSAEKVDLDLVPTASRAIPIPRHPHYLLWSCKGGNESEARRVVSGAEQWTGEGKIAALTSGALDHALRLGEDRTTRAERVDVLPGLVARLVRVDARHATRRIRERLGQALDRTEIHLQTHRNDERVVREGAARICADRVLRRVEGSYVFGYVRYVRGDELCERSSERRLPFKASTDESPVRSSIPRGVSF
jgi:hypothetical protein